jgi:hypothetical protein
MASGRGALRVLGRACGLFSGPPAGLASVGFLATSPAPLTAAACSGQQLMATRYPAISFTSHVLYLTHPLSPGSHASALTGVTMVTRSRKIRASSTRVPLRHFGATSTAICHILSTITTMTAARSLLSGSCKLIARASKRRRVFSKGAVKWGVPERADVHHNMVYCSCSFQQHEGYCDGERT